MRKKPAQQRSKQMVANIIKVAGRIIAEEGLDALTTNRVSERAGISNGSLYQYFHDRNDLVEALIDNVSDDFMRMFNEQLQLVELRQMDIYPFAKLGLEVTLAFLRTNDLYFELIRNWHRLPVHRFLDPMEKYLLDTSRLYFLSHAGEYPLEDLHTRLYVLINSCLFTLLRFLSQEHSVGLNEQGIVHCLAQNIALSLQEGQPLAHTESLIRR